MRRLAVILLVLWKSAAAADYRITRDFGGTVSQYKTKYAAIRDRGERVVIDGICNSACTLVLGIVPLNRVCVTPRASFGFHLAYTEAFGFKLTSYAGTADLVSYYPQPARYWIKHNGGLTTQMLRLQNAPPISARADAPR